MELQNSNVWEIFGFQRPSASGTGGLPSHCSETVASGPSQQDQLADSLEKGLQLDNSYSPVEVLCAQETTTAPELVLPSMEAKPKVSGLSSSWCAPVRVFTGLDTQQAVSSHSKSLPLLTIDIQHDAPIWSPVSPVQCHQPSQSEGNTLPPVELCASAICQPSVTDPICEGSPNLDQALQDHGGSNDVHHASSEGSPPHCQESPKNKTPPTPRDVQIVSSTCQFCEKAFKSANSLDKHLQKVHRVPRQNKPLRSVSSPPKNGRWCPACVGYVFDDFSKAAHDGLHHPANKPKVSTAPPHSKALCHILVLSAAFVGCRRKLCSTMAAGPPKAGPSSRVEDLPHHSSIESESAKSSQPINLNSVQPQIQGGLSIIGSDLIVKFPIDPLFSCPVKGCRFQSKTKTWYATNHSLKRHLLISHKKRDLSVLCFCSICYEPINRKPSSHSCLKASGLILKQSTPATAWDCQECGETFPTKVGLDNHCLAHKKEAIKIKDIPVLVPPPTKAKRVARKERIRRHAVGAPALAPLSGLPQNTVTDSSPPPEDTPLPSLTFKRTGFSQPLSSRSMLCSPMMTCLVRSRISLESPKIWFPLSSNIFVFEQLRTTAKEIPLAGKSWTFSTPRQGATGGTVGNSSAN
ncbi:hypothetical protein TNCT_256141 [Trichonephila clavata]|uniref:C2H2-type domain-containing protein n=1 Tax=Trichonephila clavata TaxID=2740835 RepID=A0A8X6L3K5_TRICU|nr:hypothetical protein TNCT_256141 [Trichonephila clavata]